MPLVSICIPTYNASKTIRETIESLVSQTFTDIEIIISDNASDDSTVKIAEEYARKDKRIKVVRNEENIGGEGNFTRCMHLGNGEFTAIYHSDDIYNKDIVKKQVEFFHNNPEAGAVFTASNEIDENGIVTEEKKKL